MRKRLLPGEYVYRDEVFPILMVGVVINLVGGYLVGLKGNGAVNGWFSIQMFWQDTGGTAFVALALGPWWGAAAGVISSTLNTVSFSEAFAYATVNVGLGIAWGYVARLVRSDAVLIAPKLAALRGRAIVAAVALLFTGAIAATIVADLVKLSLIELAGGDIFQGQRLYGEVDAWLRGVVHGVNTRAAALIAVDFYQNLFDKGLSLVIALILVNMMGVTPSSQMSSMTTAQRLRVGGDSIIFFAAVYAFYLLLGRILLTRLHFEHSPTGSGIDNWMGPVGVLLLFPFAIAYVAFIFATLKSGRPGDERVERNRADREDLYEHVRHPKPWSRSNIERSEYFSLFQKNSVYGVVSSLLAWPVRERLPAGVMFWSYLTSMLVISSFFFLQRRHTMEMFRRAMEWRTGIRTGFGEGAESAAVIQIFLDITSDVLTPASSGMRVAGRIAYQVAVNTASTGWLHELRSANAIDHVLLVAAPDGERCHQTLDVFLTKMIAATGIEAVVVLCGAYEDQDIRDLHSLCRAAQCYLIAFDANDLNELIETRLQSKDVGIVFARRQVESRFVPLFEAPA
jgi:hypothetical protein